MNREEAKQLAAIMQAYADGKTIQGLFASGEWIDLDSPSFKYAFSTYRIKQEPKLRPWKPEEVPVGAVVKCGNNRWLITACWNNNPFLNGSCEHTYEKSPTLKTLAGAEYTHSLDHGKTWLPCGVLE